MSPAKSPAKEKSSKMLWTDTADEAQRHRDITIAALSPSAPEIPSELPKNTLHMPERLLDSSIISITELLPEQLLSMLSIGQLTAVQVTTAYLQRAAVAQGLSNCLTELLPSIALERAKKLDSHFHQYQRPIGPLHGLHEHLDSF